MFSHFNAAMDRRSRIRLAEMLDVIAPPPVVNIGLLERLVSLVVGAIVVLVITRRFMLYSGLAVAGSYLVYRGVTGYCPFYAGEQIDTRNGYRRLFVAGGSQQNKQDNYARQTATSSWQSERDVGQVH